MFQRRLIVAITTLLAFSPLLAQEIHFPAGTTLAQAITQSDYCYIRVEEAPLVFARGELATSLGDLNFHVNEIDYRRARELPIGRTIEIKKERLMFVRNTIKFDDNSINNMAITWRSRADFMPVHEMEIEQFHRYTDGKLSFFCTQEQLNRSF